MNVNFIKVIIAFAISPLTGFSQGGDFTIEGKINPKHNGKFVKLYYAKGETKTVDSVVVSKGAFLLKGNVPLPTVGKLSLDKEDAGDYIDVFLSEGEILVSAKDSIHYASVKGTRLAETYERFARMQRPADDVLYKGLRTFKNMPDGEEKKTFFTNLMAGFDDYNKRKRELVHHFVAKNPASYVSLYILNKSAPAGLANYETSYPVYTKLSDELKMTSLGQELGKRLLALKGMTGQSYKDFVSTTPEGKSLSLKEVISQNKYTLVDFWASWCGPCRKENPNVVKAFNAFKDKGFTVMSVSLDEDAAKWKAAIEKDGMPWYHVSSLKGWKEPAAVLYGIRAIPQNVLVDDQGKVVAVNLRAETLYNKVEELLN